MSKVAIIKLTSGEEIVASIISNSENVVLIEKPLGIGFEPTPQGMKFGFAPFSPLSLDPKPLNASAIQFIAEPNEDILAQYQKVTGSIVTPPSKILTR